MQDICYDPQTSGGLLMAISEKDAERCLIELKAVIPDAAQIGYVTAAQDASIYLK